MGALALTAQAQVSPSVFVEGAFNGNWAITSNNEPTLFGNISFRAIDPTGAPALINSFGDPNFAAVSCPPATQKREFYAAVFDFQGGGEIYACTSGTRLVGRYQAYTGNNRGFFEIFETNPGASPTWRGRLLRDGGDGNFDNMFATYQGGGIATPLAQRAGTVSILSSDPAPTATLPADTLLTLTALVRYDLETGQSGFVRLALFEGTRLIQESIHLPVQTASPVLQSQLTVSPARIPAGSGQVQLRADLLGTNGAVLESSPAVLYNYASAPATLSVAPTSLVFGARLASPQRIEQTVLITKAGSGESVLIAAARQGSSSWLESVTLSKSSVDNAQPTLLKVVVNSQGQAAGTYLDAVRVTSPLGTIDIPVTLVVSRQGPVLFLNKTGLRFETRQGQGSSLTGNVGVRNLGDAGSVLNWSARVLSGASLVNLTPPSGVSVPGAGSNLAVTVSPTGTNTLGPNYALIEVSDPNALNSPQYISVVIDVAPAASPTIPQPSPAGFYFTGVQGGAQPEPQVLRVNVSRMDSANFTATARTLTGGNWLNVSPASGVASTSNPGRIDIQASTVGLAPGVYRGTVDVNVESTVRSTKITLLVQAPPAAAIRAAAGCTPTQAVIVETSLIANFFIPLAFPANLTARMFDDCGDPRGDGSVVATFSNGDAPLSLAPDSRAGDYSATWVPGLAAAQAAVTLTAAIPGLRLDTLVIGGAVGVNATPPPVIAPGGILHNLNPIVGAPLAPGTVTQIFGDNFAAAPASASALPLPLALQAVEVIMGPRSAPLFFASKTQLNVQIPPELPPRPVASLVVVNGVPSVPEMVNLAPVMPGTVAFPDGRLVAQHADFTLVTPENPARPGEALILYLVGMGATTPPVAAAVPSPGNPPATVNVQPEVTVGGRPAEILFAGLTPGGVGLYQINLRVPPDAPSGLAEVVIAQGGVRANVAQLVIAR